MKGSYEFNGILGFLSYLWRLWLFWIIKLCTLLGKRRMPVYVADSYQPLEVMGFLASKKAWKLELPKPNYLLKDKTVDEVSMKGFNSNGDCLIVQIIRKPANKTDVVVYLKLKGTGRYQLPVISDVLPEFHDSESWCYRGLKIQCISPMRKWRISFNGFLRNLDDGSEVIQVKFAFIWTAISAVFDFEDNLFDNVLTEMLFKELPFKLNLKGLNFLDQYEQWGQFLGTVSIEESPEKELYLWGPRKRNTGEDISLFTSQTKFYCHMKDGTVFHLATANPCNLKHELKYGYLIPPCQRIQALREWKQLHNINENFQLNFSTGNKRHIFNIEENPDRMIAYLGEKQNIQIEMKQAVFFYNGVQHKGIIERVKIKERRENLNTPQRKPFILQKELDVLDDFPTVVSLNDPMCRNCSLTGGKGSSLATLTTISHNIDQQNEIFLVPKGLVITTAAYRQSLTPNLLQQIQCLQSNIGKKMILEKECDKVSQEFCKLKLPQILKESLKEKLKHIWKQNFDSVMFAVRSSSVAEDSSDTSAAGQMETFLGVRGLNQICDSIAKCWGSQFSYISVSYKVQTGQILDTDMAVVIQEMIPADVAGVVFTCDPITGNPAKITITANYGLGESVVSATAEPDTIVLKRTWDNKLSIYTQTIGKKTISIKISDTSGTRTDEIQTEDREKCCLQLEMIEKLGQIAVQIEECYGSSRDIEWCIKQGVIYLLQARPITTAHQETEFELIHEFDSGLISEDEYYTTANIAEVWPGAISPLSTSTMCQFIELALQIYNNRQEGEYSYYHPEFRENLPISHRHMFFSLTNCVLKRVEKNSDLVSKGWEYAMLGRALENGDEIRNLAVERFGYYPPIAKIKGMIYVPLDLLLNTRRVKTWKEHMEGTFNLRNISDVHLLYKDIHEKLNKYVKSVILHYQACLASMVCNSIVLNVLAYANSLKADEEVSEDLLVQFSNILSNVKDVESADVPAYLEKFANIIRLSDDVDYFMDKDDQKVLEWVKSDKGEIGQMFRNFISQHGHRCIKEFDLISKPWELEPMSLIKILQSMVDYPIPKKRTNTFIARSLKPLTDSLDLRKKLVLKIFTFWAKMGIKSREQTKSLLIKTTNVYRKAYTKLGEMMEKEGRIPDARLIFFITHEEIGRLLKKREFHIINKAIRRRRIHPSLDSFLFPEIISGPAKPFENKPPDEEVSSDWSVKGIPVCNGIVTGVVRVIRNREDVSLIQSGEILVTYSTDIGWSPYFPLLAGLVTEIGGLISHGAVIAREYGLPCIIAANGVLSLVRTGEMVILDANRGVLKKMQ